MLRKIGHAAMELFCLVTVVALASGVVYGLTVGILAAVA
jgi:flagellar biosynthesis protein FliQ